MLKRALQPPTRGPNSDNMGASAVMFRPAVSKKEIDFLFGLKISEWQTRARTIFGCDWNIAPDEHQMGYRLSGFHPPTGIAVSVQPMYSSDDESPFMMIIGNYIPLGGSPPATDSAISDIGACVQRDLGSAYDVRCRYTTLDRTGIIEIVVTQATHPGEWNRGAAERPAV